MFAVFSPYFAALIAFNVLGQADSKLQDYTMFKLEIAAAYDLATMSFDALCNQSVSFHSNRFGGTLVSQTSKFMSAYQLLLETITFPFLPVICSVIFTCAILAPRVPVYVVILMALLVVYACVSYYMYKRILSLNEKAASAQNQLSGELSDSVANILAVKTSGREDYERAQFRAGYEGLARTSEQTCKFAVLNMPVLYVSLYTATPLIMWFGGNMILSIKDSRIALDRTMAMRIMV